MRSEAMTYSLHNVGGDECLRVAPHASLTLRWTVNACEWTVHDLTNTDIMLLSFSIKSKNMYSSMNNTHILYFLYTFFSTKIKTK